MSNLDLIKKYNLKQVEANQANLQSMIKSLDALMAISKQMAEVSDKLETSGFLNYKDIPPAISELGKRIDNLPKPADLTPAINKLSDSLKSQKVEPIINVPPLDLKPIQTSLESLTKQLKNQEAPQIDLSALESNLNDVQQAVEKVEGAISSLSFPVPNFVLPFKDTNGKASQAQLNSSGELPVAIGSANVTLVASDIEIGAVELKNGTDDTRATITAANALKVDNSAVTQPVSGTFYQATQPVSLATNTPDVTDRAARLVGHVTVDSAPTTAVTGPITDVQIRATPLPVSGTVTANAGTNLNTSSLALDATLTGGTQKSKLVDTGGTNVASVSAAGALKVDASSVAVPITDNSGSLTVDAPVGTPAFVRLSDGAAAITTLPVSLATNTPTLQSGSTTAVTQPTGTNLHTVVDSGTITSVTQLNGVAVSLNVGASDTGTQRVTLGNGTQTIGALTANQTVNNAQIAGTATSVNAGALDAGTQRVVNALTATGTVLASASRGVATVNTDFTNSTGKGIIVWQDLTVLGASSVVTLKIQSKDPVSAKFVDILASAATGAGINSTGTITFKVYPGLTAAANLTVNDVLPQVFRIVSTVATAASTFSIGYSIIP